MKVKPECFPVTLSLELALEQEWFVASAKAPIARIFDARESVSNLAAHV